LWSTYFADLTVAGTGRAPDNLPADVNWYSYDEQESRAEVWNNLIQRCEVPWVFFLEDDEQLRFSSFPSRPMVDEQQWIPAIIQNNRQGAVHQYYHTRLVNTTALQSQRVFEGYNLPDATHYIRSNEIDLVSNPIIIERESNPFAHIDTDEELSQKAQSPRLYLVQGRRYFQDKKYVRAAAQFRQLLKKEKLLPFDRLAAVNGLASCLTEQHKWEKALSLCEQSLTAESLQRLPYLIQFRIHELRKEWQKAFEALKQYYDRLSLDSRASFDRQIDEEKTLVNLANVALKNGNRARATAYFEELFTFKRDNADRDLLEKALLLSIELNDFKRSVYLFERLYSDLLPPHQMDQEYREEIDEVMTMFMNQEWYEYVSGIYNKLHNAYPDDREYKRKFIVTLTKTNRLDKAKKMVANIV
jgi:hypothetical protein